MAEIAKKAAAMEGGDFVVLNLDGGDPNGVNKSTEELIAVVKEVAEAIDCPLVVEGCKNVEKDAELLPKVAEALQGRNVIVMSEKEENYKAIGAAAGLAYNQIVGAESADDINLAKQLNVVTTQLGVDAKKIVMNVGTASVGYGYEYVVSTMDRIKGAALSQNDNMLQMPIITPVSSETPPRTMSLAGAFSSVSGRFRSVRRFSVTSSPVTPSPRVAPRTNTPFSYSSDMDRPSIFGSTE